MAKVRVRKETGTLYLDFFHRGVRCREQTALDDTPANRRKVAKVLEKIEAEIKLGIFDYARHFPTGRHVSRFAGSDNNDPSAPAPESLRALVAASVQERFGSPPPAPVSAVPVPAMVAVAVPFKDFAETWVRENEVQWRRSYRLTVQGIIDGHLLPKFGETPVHEVARESILQFRADLAKVKGRKRSTLSPRRVNAVMNVLSLIINEATDRYKFISPYYNIKPLKLAKPDVEPFTMEEVRRITEEVREDYRDYFLIRFFTGMRTGEIDGLKWQYVDFEHRLILIRETIVGGVEDEETKTRESHRDIQMSELVYQALLRQKVRTAKQREVRLLQSVRAAARSQQRHQAGVVPAPASSRPQGTSALPDAAHGRHAVAGVRREPRMDFAPDGPFHDGDAVPDLLPVRPEPDAARWFGIRVAGGEPFHQRCRDNHGGG